MKTSELGIIALTPAAWTGKDFYPGIAISALRSGAIGVVDLEYIDLLAGAKQALEPLLTAEGSGGIGIRCGVEQVTIFQPLVHEIASAPPAVKVVILCVRDNDFDKKSLSQCIQALHKQKFAVICEVVTLAEGKLVQSAGADAVIAKGHESAGRVGEETSFILLQRCRHELTIPVWVRGGVGINSSAAIMAAGCAGVVLDSQLLISRESPLSIEQKEKLSNFDGTETELFELGKSEKFRLWIRPGDESARNSLEQLKAAVAAGQTGDTKESKKNTALQPRTLLRTLLSGYSAAGSQLPPAMVLGQDIAFASSMARQHISVNGIVASIKNQSKHYFRLAAQQGALLENSPLASSHGTKYPILQGAMTRVSDTADFALRVAEGGGLPFLALALMRQKEIEPLLKECSEKLSGTPWGVGMLGFVPPELRQEQLQLVLKHRPPCALIAGGRPDQAKELESNGIKTYLHVPSPALLHSFVEMGARRFIFEGKECGGHVGPRSSFVLWESMIETLLSVLPPKSDPSEFHVVFAGGIHDSMSSAMVAAMSAPLVERGVRIGILMGTAYLFTREAVSSGAIVSKFQEAALNCDETVLLETGPGHAIRCVNSPYKQAFDEKRQVLEKAGYGKNELRQELELMNLGRLRVASKGLARGEAGAATGSKLVKVSAEKQWSDGMYMIGQVAAMHDKTTTIKELHESASIIADKYLKSMAVHDVRSVATEQDKRKQHEAIAVVGMSCMFPKANDHESYWENIINKVDTIEEIPKEQWDWTRLYSADPLERDKIYSKWGGFLKDIPFDPSIYGIPPASLASIDPMQLLILEVTRAALHDAGYQQRSFPKDKTSIILANAGHGPITAFYSLRSMLDWTLSDVEPSYRKELEKRLPEWTEDSFPGYLGNVVAGRVANRFDLGGINFCVDAACASSLAALYIGIQELRAGTSELVLLAATDTHNQPGDYLSFSKTHALSPRGRCRTFDASADGIVISEGIAVLVLKRLADAERDGDRIYSLIRGIGGSSDGRDLSLTAPRPAGQMASLRRAYDDAGISPATVELVEAHGTGTVAGDKAEVEALRNLFEGAGAGKQICAIGSVKTMIGHSKCAAGLASIIKVSRALYHKVLPPTIGVETPNPACNFGSSPFYVNSETRPWLHDSETLGYPRRAGVSAFGFGGTNFHAVLEEYVGMKSERQGSVVRNFPSELFCFRSASRAQLQRSIEQLAGACKNAIELHAQPKGPLGSGEPCSLFDLSYRQHLAQSNQPAASSTDNRHLHLSIVAASLEDLLKKLDQAKQIILDESKKTSRDPRGVFFEDRTNNTAASAGKVAFLFPGQGAQHLNMLQDLVLNFVFMQDTFQHADNVLAEKFEQRLSRYIYPSPVFSEEERQKQSDLLTDTHLAQPAVAAADLAAFKLLSAFGLKPDMCAGHSFGEYVALTAAGSMFEDDLFSIAEQRGHILKNVNSKKSGSMIAVTANDNDLRGLIADVDGITLANVNSPRQCIISGDLAALAQASKLFEEKRIKFRPIAVSAAFHSPLMHPAQKPLSRALLDLTFQEPKVEVYSNTLAKAYPEKPEQIASLLCEHLVKPVEFQKQIEHMYEAGARIFIECGPGSILTGLVDDILDGKEHLSICLERSGKHGVTQLQYLLAQAFVAGLALDMGKLYRHRVDSLLAKNESKDASRKPKLTYLINGSHIKRYDGKTASPANRPTEHALVVASAGEPLSHNFKTQQAGIKNNAVPQAKLAQQTNKLPGATQSAPQSGPIQKPVAAQRTSPAISPNVKQISVPDASMKSAKNQVMIEFQKNMLDLTNTFLQTQERVMLAYLQQQQQGLTPPAPVAEARSAGGSPASTDSGAWSAGGSPASNRPALPLEQLDETMTRLAQATQKNVVIAHEQPLDNAEKNKNGHEPVPSNSPSTLEPQFALSKLNSESLISQLVQIVSERTGYPSEMLDPTLDLEADLGIDSIKRVEILNSFRKLLPDDVQAQLESGIEKLAGTKTLQGIFDWIRSDLSAPGIEHTATDLTAPSTVSPRAKDNNGQVSESKGNSEEPAPTAVSRKPSSGMVARALVVTKELEYLPSNLPLLSGLFLITDSEDGLADSLSQEIQKAGADFIVLRHRESVAPQIFDWSADRIELDLCNEELLGSFMKLLQQKKGKQLGGLIHLLPLHNEFQAEIDHADALQAYAPVRSLYAISRAILSLQGQDGTALKIFSASGLGGTYGVGADEFNPVHAAIPGLIKTIAREYPSCSARCVDFAGGLEQAKMCQWIMAEIGHIESTLVEVGYTPWQRLTPEALPVPLASNQTGNGLDLDSSSVVLVTGGARGITAELCVELGLRNKPCFVLVGRGVRPAEPEESIYKGLTTPKEIKAAIIDRLRKESKPLSVPAIELIYQKLLKDREIRHNLERIEATGSRVHYYSLDVRNRTALCELIDRLYESFGKIDAVINGAGVIEDAYIKDKTLDSFDRVFGTKVDAAFTLASRLQLDSLKYLVFFSSVVGRTGNAGQADYVAANEVMNKLAIKLNKTSPCRVLSIGWGPWRGGMASDDLESIFARYGWSMIESSDGRQCFYDELRFGPKADAEVLLVGQLKKSNGNGGNGTADASHVQARGARINRAEVLKHGAGEMQLRLRLDPDFDVYLKDHAFDGTPVLPMAVAAELMAEAAQFMYPAQKLQSLQKMDIPSGIMFDKGPRDLFINLKELSFVDGCTTVDVFVSTGAAATRRNFTAEAVLSNISINVIPDGSHLPLNYVEPVFADAETPPTVQHVYTNWLFHGPLFQGIDSVDGIGRNGIAGQILSVPIEESLKETGKERWVIDPLLLDSAMQFAGIWARNYMDITALPTGFKTLRLFSPPVGRKYKAVVEVPQESKNGQLLCNMAVYSESGNLVMFMEDLGGVGSKSLNRLATQPKSMRKKP